MLWCLRFGGLGAGGLDGLDRQDWHREQFAGPRDVLGTGGAGEQAVVADAMEAVGEDVDQEAANELAVLRASSPCSARGLRSGNPST